MFARMSLPEVLDRISALAERRVCRIVLPDAAVDARVLHAAVEAARLGIAAPVLVGNVAALKDLAHRESLDIGPLEIAPDTPATLNEMALWYQERRRPRELLNYDAASTLVTEPLWHAACLVGMGLADGMVAGAGYATASVLRAAIRCIGLAAGFQTASSYFIMCLPQDDIVTESVLLFADCAVVVEPTVEQLADIAISTADSASGLLGMEPRVAMLSFSTHGSAQHASVTKMREAALLVQRTRPGLACDGELQVDAALIQSVAQRKASASPVAGHANVLIFPNLDAGNIGYKLVQRLGGARAIGPILQGIARPVNDLSRGCSVEDIVCSIAITAAQANTAGGS